MKFLRTLLYLVLPPAGVLICLFSGCGQSQSVPNVSAPPTAIASKASSGTVFHVPDTPIIVRLPVEPSLDQQTVQTKVGPLHIRIYTAVDDLTNYSVAVNDYPKGAVDAIAADREKFLTHMADSAIKARAGSKVLLRRRASFAAWTGLEEKVEMPSGRTGELHPELLVVAARQYYQEGDRMYLIQVLAPKAVHDLSPAKFDQDARALFESLEMPPEREK